MMVNDSTIKLNNIFRPQSKLQYMYNYTQQVEQHQQQDPDSPNQQ